MICEHPECNGNHHSGRKGTVCPAFYQARLKASRDWRREHYTPEPWGTCDICGSRIRSDNSSGLCSGAECRAEYNRRRSRDEHFIRVKALGSARSRARAQGLPFTLTEENLPALPDKCPILGITLVVGGGSNSPSLDRKVGDIGYVPGNVWWISKQANTMKSDADRETLRNFGMWAIRWAREAA